MTAPRYADCRCTHSKADHERDGFAPQCTATGCTCLQYRPVVAAVPAPSTAPSGLARPDAPRVPIAGPVPEPTVDQLVAAGKRSTTRRTAALAEKVETLVAELRTRLKAERMAAEERRVREAKEAESRRKVAELEEQLKAARAALGVTPARKPGPRARVGDQTCPDCGKGGLANIGTHRFRAHGIRKDTAS